MAKIKADTPKEEIRQEGVCLFCGKKFAAHYEIGIYCSMGCGIKDRDGEVLSPEEKVTNYAESLERFNKKREERKRL